MAALLVLFLLSGAVGLGFQVLWSQSLLDFIGASAVSYSTVLAAFMGGLAIGSAVLGRLADRAPHPLRLYAVLEAGIGTYALAFPVLLEAASGLYARWAAAAPAGGGSGLAAKGALSALLLLPPTVLMGGTYPALIRHAARTLGLVGRRASQLYSVNAAGAVLGTLATAFVLMPGLGMRRSLLALALANGLVALGALILASGRAPLPVAAAPADEGPSLPRQPRPVTLALGLIGAEGVLAFGLEVSWTRFFALVLGSSTYSFALMLAAFISGIALGSAWLSRFEARVDRPLVLFGWALVLAGLSALLPLSLYPYLPWLFLTWGSLFSTQPAAFYLYEGGKLLAAALIMLPCTVLLGMALPLLVKGVAHDLAALGRDAGRVYAWNTWGNVAGALLAGLVLLPGLGVESLLRAIALALCAAGILTLALYLPPGRASRSRVGAAAVVVALSPFLVAPWRTEWFTFQASRRFDVLDLRQARQQVERRKMLLFRDDAAAHVMVFDAGAEPRPARRLAVNGKVDASSDADMPTQILSAHIPLVLAPRADDVLVVGLASGVTAGAALAHPLRSLDVVELVGAMPEASRLFAPWNGDPLADGRLRLVVDDARSYLSYTDRRYDVIVSEPSNPWMAGTGALFSRDFYRRAAQALRPGGVYLQWLQTYEMGDETFAAAVRTFRTTFPHVYAFQGNANDCLLLGTRTPLQPDWDEAAARIEAPEVRRSLARLAVEDLGTLLAFQRLSPSTVDLIAAQTDLENSDDNRLLEYRAPRDLFARRAVSLVDRWDERLHSGPGLLWSRYRQSHPDGVRPAATFLALSLGRARVAGVAAAYEQAVLSLDREALASGPAASLFPAAGIPGPKEPLAFAGEVGRLIRAGRAEWAAERVETLAPALLLEAALDPERARLWLSASKLWVAPPAAVRPPRLRRFRIELLLATGHEAEAERDLRAWIQESPGPEWDWAVGRACEAGRGALCADTLAEAQARSGDPAFRRLGDLPL